MQSRALHFFSSLLSIYHKAISMSRCVDQNSINYLQKKNSCIRIAFVRHLNTILLLIFFSGRLNTDTSPQNFWTTVLNNDLTKKFKKSAVANAIAIPLPLYFSCFVLLRRFRENLTKPFYFYLSRTCDSPGGTPSVFSLALRGGSTRLKIAWVQQRQYHRAHGSARERVLSLALNYFWKRLFRLTFFLKA